MSSFRSNVVVSFIIGFMGPVAFSLYADSLVKFFHGPLNGCTLRTLLRYSSEKSKSTFNDLVGGYLGTSRPEYLTVILEPLSLHEGALPSVKRNYNEWFYKNYTSPMWIMKHHTVCNGHMYFVDTPSDIKNMNYFHFADFVLRHESPEFVLIWEVESSHLDWRQILESHEFISAFMDYRINIRKDPITLQYNAYMICIICRSQGKQLPVKQVPATKTELHSMWKSMHTTHVRNRHKIVFFEFHTHDGLFTKLTSTRIRLEHVIPIFYNMTKILIYKNRSHFRSHGWISYRVYETDLAGWSQELFLYSRFPAYVMSPAYIVPGDNKQITVVRKSLFSRIGWMAIFAPFEVDVWILLVVTFVSLCGIIYQIHLTQFASIVLCIASRITDHSYDIQLSRPLQTVVLLWTLYCLSLTMLYGGDLGSYMVTLVPPSYPKNAAELYDSKSPLLTTTDDLINDPSLLISEVGERQRMVKVASEIKRNFCSDLVFNTTDSEKLVHCKINSALYTYEMPLTFIDSDIRSSSMRIAFQSSNLFWVSPTTHLRNAQQKFPMHVRKNYWGKLVLPFLSSWTAMGLEAYWYKTREYTFQKMYHFPNQWIPRHEQKSSPVNFAHSLQLSSFTSVIVVVYVLAGISTLALLVEGISKFQRPFHFCDWRAFFVRPHQRKTDVTVL